MIKNIIRKKYSDQIIGFLDKDVIKVLVGQRRSGKSMILLGLIDMLEVQGVFQEKSYIYINKESLERDHIKNYQDLYDAVKEYHYIFVDEIQDIIERERAIRSLYAEKNHDIIITGSNSNLLSTDLSTYLSGRYVQIHIYPLDFKEFLEFHQIKKSKESFFKYMEYGGMPHLLRLGLDQRSMQYLKDIYETIVLKDIVKRYKIRNVSFFEQLIIFIAKNIGSIFSTVNISNALAENNIDILPNVINEYLQYAQRALFLYGIDRYDIKGKKIFERKQKYFLSDVGLRNSLVGYNTRDRGRMLENIVFCCLIANGRTVYTGEIGDKEIDFVAKKEDKMMYIQVAYLLESETTIQREYAPLLDVSDGRPRYLVTLDDDARGTYEGIQHRSIIDFVEELSE